MRFEEGRESVVDAPPPLLEPVEEVGDVGREGVGVVLEEEAIGEWRGVFSM